MGHIIKYYYFKILKIITNLKLKMVKRNGKIRHVKDNYDDSSHDEI